MEVNIKEIEDKAKKMLANFVDTIGMDGDYYVNATPIPRIIYGNPFLVAEGVAEFIQPGEQLNKMLSRTDFSPETKEEIMKEGLIAINEIEEPEDLNDLHVTIIHETIHSKRNILYTDEPNTEKYSDFSQDIIKGHVDESTVSDDCLQENEVDAKMARQYYADETLVEVMSYLAYKLFKSKEQGENTSLWDTLEQLKDEFEDFSIETMCDLILKHHDYELFHWMIDPLGYTNDDIHYDFFEEYTKNDKELVEELYERKAEEVNVDEIAETFAELREYYSGLVQNNQNTNNSRKNKDIDNDYEER